jgi:hypothetical protein
VTPREVRVHEAGERLAPSLVLRQALEQSPRLLDRDPHGLGDDGLLRLELAVERAVGEAGGLGDRVDARAVDPSFPKQAGGGRKDSPPVIGRLLFRYTHERTPLDSFDGDRHECASLT